MREADFAAWLRYRYVGRDAQALAEHERHQRLSLARRIERFEGDLDHHFEADGMSALLQRLIYSRGDHSLGKPVQHNVPVRQDAYGMTSNLRHVANLYRRFRESPDDTSQQTDIPRIPRSTLSMRGHDWPVWSQPSAAEILALAKVLTPHVRLLHPDIIAAVVDDNELGRERWRNALGERGVDPNAYLWERSATVFPGIRRHAGGAEVAELHAGRRRADPKRDQALLLDDNHYPKHIWSFAVRGRPFQNAGPNGYQLAHLVDHKAYKSRGTQELVGPVENHVGPGGLPGLFTSAANTVYVPSEFLRPTDFSPLLRNLLQRRAAELYGERCNLLPPPLGFREAPSPAWETTAFNWSEPVGTLEQISGLLEFRSKELDRLFGESTQSPD